MCAIWHTASHDTIFAESTLIYVQSLDKAFALPTFAKDFKSLATRKARPTDADKRDLKDSRFTGFSLYQMNDNWLHVRKLFSALTVYKSSTSAAVQAAERDTMMVIAAMKGAATDPTPWLLVLDYVLRDCWQAILKTQGSAAQGSIEEDARVIFSNIFSELCLFAHGTAVNAIVIRYPLSAQVTGSYTPESMAKHLDAWYQMLYDFDPRCANPSCLRLLPNPSTVKGKLKFRTLFSVGTRQARVGKHGSRAFISTNRLYAHPCLYTAIYGRK
ncbi:hypothetical protein W97_09189 [Coniosporium apollinis CBS 100218]|uniref:Uncharacterized protein n=1 Tax=Coniosporium apollinis (strain CBS 100218) TaxID=1168221 RepID=R7Z7C7_CONA1|nr:uncharacterized protein W97_09189 [Coniosporium apollinis CBS 100218]EON69924.1 hypothetical protein W97_09189 [Coniosporium apollinis CBS 100218]